jgi:hypothetical protein
MANISDSTRRRDPPGSYVRQQPPLIGIESLPPPIPISSSLIDALDRRRSAEAFGRIDRTMLSSWLYYVAHSEHVHRDDLNRERRSVASFGALHPVHIVLGEPTGEWSVYIPRHHIIGRVDVNAKAANSLLDFAKTLFKTSDAILVALLADLTLAENYYDSPQELLLRDGGVLYGHAALVASGLELGFRILGETGSPYLEQLLSNLPFTPMAVGLAWIGGA